MNTYVMCIDNSKYLASLDLLKVYRVIRDAEAEENDMIRVVDNSGEDYLYSAKRFEPVELTETGQQAVERAPA